MNDIQKNILNEIADIDDIPSSGAYNIRLDGACVGRASTVGVEITPKEVGSGLDIKVAPGVKETIYIPVVISKTGLQEEVLNDFFIGEGANITIIAGCGICNQGEELSQHDGIHSFYVGKNAKVRYVEKHLGEGDGKGKRILNPVTNVFVKEGGYLEMETIQIKGVDSTKRLTKGELGKDATLIVSEKLMTHGEQFAQTAFEVDLNGQNCSTHLVSRSVAKDKSKQVFISKIDGNNACVGHSECDAIIMGDASVSAIPEVTANHVDASLVHEAAIGKIAGEQLIKLMTLGLSEDEAEEQIVNGFLK